jgi:hypothetical protein
VNTLRSKLFAKNAKNGPKTGFGGFVYDFHLGDECHCCVIGTL